MKRLFSFLTGAFIGGLVGATIAILLAPYSGEELQKELRQRFRAFQDDLSNAVSERRVELEKKLDDMRQPKAAA